MNKIRKRYKSIGEVSKEISISSHTLRFWESEFKQIKPVTFNGNRRYYTQKDIDILKIIYELLKKQGYTIAGAKRLLNQRSVKLDEHLDLDIKRKNFQSSLKYKAQRIKIILDKIKGLKDG
tara:strand:- start:712 stop:1074 length:363 start_codon:yes stop_codon:yes gene_type:complete